LIIRNVGKAICALRVALCSGENFVAFDDVCKSIIEQGEHGWGNFLTKPVTGAEILVDPNLHRFQLLLAQLTPLLYTEDSAKHGAGGIWHDR